MESGNGHSHGRKKEVGVTRAGLGGFLGGMFKGADDGEATRGQYSGIVTQVNALDVEMQGLGDEELRSSTAELQKRARAGESLDSLLPVWFT